MTSLSLRTSSQHQSLRRNPLFWPTKRKVEVKFEFEKIGFIDLLGAKFQAQVAIESKWLTDEFIEYDSNKHWNPKLYIENARNDVIEKLAYEVIQNEKNIYVHEYRIIKGTFWLKSDFTSFPMDVQKLNIMLNSKLDSNDVYLVQNFSERSFINLNTIRLFEDQEKWHLFKMVKTMEDMPINSAKKNLTQFIYLVSPSNNKLTTPTLSAIIYIARKPVFYLVNAFFFIFLINLIAFTIFSIDFYSPHFRLATSLTILLTSISFKWVINRSLPHLSHLHSLDIYHLVSVCFICLLIVWHSLIGTFLLGKLSKEQCFKLDIQAFFVFVMLFVVKQMVFLGLLLKASMARNYLYKAEREFLEDFRDHVHDSIDLRMKNEKDVEMERKYEKGEADVAIRLV